MSELIRPMLAKPGPLPTGPDWTYEMKWDGVRAVVYVDPDSSTDPVRLFSRNDRDVSVSYPEFAGMADVIGADVVLDGEIVALDSHGRPSFALLQQRMHVADPAVARRLSREVPVVLLVFDLLRLGENLLLDHSYEQRRELLERLDIDTAHWQTPPVFEGDGAEAMAASRAQQLEGVVAKRRSSLYRPGARTGDWIKVKNLRTQEVVVGGWRSGEGRRSGTVGALLLGVPDTGGLHFVGRVGTGFTDAMLGDLQRRLEARAVAASPFADELLRAEVRGAHWARPELVGEVEYSERTPDGRLRHPVWRGLRPDKSAADVVWED